MTKQFQGTAGPWWLGEQGEICDCFTEVHSENHGALASVVTQMAEHDSDFPQDLAKQEELLCNARAIAMVPYTAKLCEIISDIDIASMDERSLRLAMTSIQAQADHVLEEIQGDEE